jgi:hypothetical protein
MKRGPTLEQHYRENNDPEYGEKSKRMVDGQGSSASSSSNQTISTRMPLVSLPVQPKPSPSSDTAQRIVTQDSKPQKYRTSTTSAFSRHPSNSNSNEQIELLEKQLATMQKVLEDKNELIGKLEEQLRQEQAKYEELKSTVSPELRAKMLELAKIAFSLFGTKRDLLDVISNTEEGDLDGDQLSIIPVGFNLSEL